MKKAFLFLCLFVPMLAFSQVGKNYQVSLPEQTDQVDVFRFEKVKISFVQKIGLDYCIFFDFYDGKHYQEDVTRIPNDSDVMVFRGKQLMDNRYEVTCVSGTIILYVNGFKAEVYEN